MDDLFDPLDGDLKAVATDDGPEVVAGDHFRLLNDSQAAAGTSDSDQVVVEDLLGGFSEFLAPSVKQEAPANTNPATSFFLLDLDSEGGGDLAADTSAWTATGPAAQDGAGAGAWLGSDNGGFTGDGSGGVLSFVLGPDSGPASGPEDSTDTSEVLSISENNLPMDREEEGQLASGFFFNDVLQQDTVVGGGTLATADTLATPLNSSSGSAEASASEDTLVAGEENLDSLMDLDIPQQPVGQQGYASPAVEVADTDIFQTRVEQFRVKEEDRGVNEPKVEGEAVVGMEVAKGQVWGGMEVTEVEVEGGVEVTKGDVEGGMEVTKVDAEEGMEVTKGEVKGGVEVTKAEKEGEVEVTKALKEGGVEVTKAEKEEGVEVTKVEMGKEMDKGEEEEQGEVEVTTVEEEEQGKVEVTKVKVEGGLEVTRVDEVAELHKTREEEEKVDEFVHPLAEELRPVFSMCDSEDRGWVTGRQLQQLCGDQVRQV